MRSGEDPDTESLLRQLLEACRRASAKPHGHTSKASYVARCGGPGLCTHCFFERIHSQVAQHVARIDAALQREEEAKLVKVELDDYDSKVVFSTPGVQLKVDIDELEQSLATLKMRAAASRDVRYRPVEHLLLRLPAGQMHQPARSDEDG